MKGSPIITYDYIGGEGVGARRWDRSVLGQERSSGGLKGGLVEENGINVVESERGG